jgi:uncharacterized lipoprotein YmbA
MIARLILAAVCSTVALAACAIGRQMPEATAYMVDPPMKVAAQVEPGPPDPLRIGNVRVAEPFAGTAMVYRFDDEQYVSDPYNVFAAEPGAMFASRVGVWLDQCGLFTTVAQPGGGQPASYVLEVTVIELYGDFRKNRRAAAVLTVQFALVDRTGPRPQLVYEHTIARRVDLPKATPDALASGYGVALGEILSQLAPQLRALIVS